MLPRSVAEIVLRFLPVATGLHSVAVDSAQPVFHFQPNFDFVYSRGWTLRDVVRGRVNNAGWVNDQDYARDAATPLIAVIVTAAPGLNPAPSRAL